MTTILLGSSSSMEGIKKLINTYYMSNTIELVEATGHENYWDVCNSKGLVKGVRVVKKKSRFRFETNL